MTRHDNLLPPPKRTRRTPSPRAPRRARSPWGHATSRPTRPSQASGSSSARSAADRKPSRPPMPRAPPVSHIPSDVRYFFVGASRDGLVPQAIRWDLRLELPVPPDHLLFQMEKATTVAGRVVDQDQKPIAGATVVVDVSKGYPKSRQWVDFKYESAKTDASGRWSFSGVPEKPDSIKLAAYHHLCLTESARSSTWRSSSRFSALRDGSATLRLRARHAHRGHGRLARRSARGGRRGLLRDGPGIRQRHPPGEDGRPRSVRAGDQAGDDLDSDRPGPWFRAHPANHPRRTGSVACRPQASAGPTCSGAASSIRRGSRSHTPASPHPGAARRRQRHRPRQRGDRSGVEDRR